MVLWWPRTCEVQARTHLARVWGNCGKKGDGSFVVRIGPGRNGLKDAHRDQLRPHVDDIFADHPFPHHYFFGKAPVVEPILSSGEYLPEKILNHRVVNGATEVLVKWQGYTQTTWEPLTELMNEIL